MCLQFLFKDSIIVPYVRTFFCEKVTYIMEELRRDLINVLKGNSFYDVEKVFL